MQPVRRMSRFPVSQQLFRRDSIQNQKLMILDTSHSEHFPMSHAFTYLFAILQNANASCHANCACHHGAILMNIKSLTPENQRPFTQDCLRMYCLLR